MLEPFRHIVHATGYSIAGLVHLLRNESAARIELAALILGLFWFLFLDRPIANFLMLLILGCVLFSVEALNTAIEVVVDRVSPEQSQFAKTAKDLGSTAVFFILAASGLYIAAVTADAFGLIALVTI